MKNLFLCILIFCNLFCGFPVISQGNDFVENDTTVQEEVIAKNYVIY